MLERSHGPWTARMARRQMLALPLVLSISACTPSANDNDPYVQAIKNDPVFSWQPSMAVTRRINYRPRNAPFERLPYSYVSIELTPKDIQVVPELLQAAEQARTQAGYSAGRKRFGGNDGRDDYWIRCDVFSVSTTAQSTIDA